nr:MAG TPA: hypothetical protein [Caudoviricetes sp.]
MAFMSKYFCAVTDDYLNLFIVPVGMLLISLDIVALPY